MSVDPSGRAAVGPRSPGLRRHAWLAVLVVGVVLFVGEITVLATTGNPNFVPTAILLGSAVVPVTFLAFVYGRRLPYTVPGGVLAVVALLGGLIGTIGAGVVEFDALRDFGALPVLGVGLIEELSKLLVPLAVFYLLRYRTQADGLVLGVACGAAFAALETMGYAFVELVKSGGSVSDTLGILLLRGLLSPAGHMAWTGIAAAGLYAAAAARWRARETGRFAVALGAAVALHALWDGIGGLVVYAVLAVVSLGLLTWAAHRAVRAAAPRPVGRRVGQA
jgi:RsiW-degrading membrane proteinase PrsW (M82 family)